MGGMVLAGLIGLILGSFASAMSWRIPRGMSWIASRGAAERSACPSCGHRLSWVDLLPLVSWLMLRGRCRYCGAGIGALYPLIELATMAGCLAAYAVYGFTAAGGIMMVAMPFLAALFVIDARHMILPDQLNILLAILGFGFVASFSSPQDMIGAAGAGCLYAALAWGLGWGMRRLLKKEALGLGDVKFFAVAGIWLGFTGLPPFLMLSGIFGTGIGIFWKYVYREPLFPFGPALVLSFIVCRLFLP